MVDPDIISLCWCALPSPDIDSAAHPVRGCASIHLRPAALEFRAVLALAIQFEVEVILQIGMAGMKMTPSRLASTRFPGSTTTLPIRTGTLIPVSCIWAHAGRSYPR
jgi:hypothetical protein